MRLSSGPFDKDINKEIIEFLRFQPSVTIVVQKDEENEIYEVGYDQENTGSKGKKL